MSIKSLKYLSPLVLAAALLVLPHAAQAAPAAHLGDLASAAQAHKGLGAPLVQVQGRFDDDDAKPTIDLEVYNDLDTSVFVDLWMGGIGSVRVPLIQARGLISRSGFEETGMRCMAESGCHNMPLEIRDVRGVVLCKAWMKWSGGDVSLRVRSSGGVAVCEFRGSAVAEVEVPGGPYNR